MWGFNIMSGYQFGHIEGYARKGGFDAKTKQRVMSGWEIIEEAERHENATPHIEEPQPPILHFGVKPSLTMKEAAEWAEQAKDSIGRKLRIDGLCLAAGVISFPADAEGWPEYRDEAIEWLKMKYGDNLKSVVEHTDEAYPHIHFYVVPKIGDRFDSVHDGYRAANEAKAQELKKGAQNGAYKLAMKSWQDELHAACGVKFGLSRIGPRKQRLTRVQWKERKAVGSQVAALLQKATEQKATEQKAEAELQAVAVLQNAEQQAAALLQDSQNQSMDVLEDAKLNAELKALEVRKAAELQAVDVVRKAEEQAQNIELQAAELLLRISAIAIACFGIIRSLLFLTYSFTLTDRNPLFFSLIHPLIRSDGCCEPIDPVTHPLPLDFRSCCTIHSRVTDSPPTYCFPDSVLPVFPVNDRYVPV